jgi:hypothetical protein
VEFEGRQTIETILVISTHFGYIKIEGVYPKQMRLKEFESAGSEPLGEGDEKKVFIDHKNETRVVSERKEGGEQKKTRFAN